MGVQINVPQKKEGSGGGGIGGAIGSVVGGIAGAFAGNPMAGAAIGGKIGGIAGGVISPGRGGNPAGDIAGAANDVIGPKDETAIDRAKARFDNDPGEAMRQGLIAAAFDPNLSPQERSEKANLLMKGLATHYGVALE
jgi:hypothetical protein